MIGLPVRGIGIALAMVVTVIIMSVADRNAKIADLDANNVLGNGGCRCKRRGGQKGGREGNIKKITHEIFLTHNQMPVGGTC